MSDETSDSTEGAFALVVARLEKLILDLARTKVDDDHDWFRTMLLGILLSTQENYQFVLAGVLQTPALACWGARNLLELQVITHYVLRSEDNAVDFMDDLVADRKQFWDNIVKIGRVSHDDLVKSMREAAMIEDEPFKSFLLIKADEEEKTGVDLTEPEKELRDTESMMEAFAVAPTRRPKAGRDIATATAELDRYSPWFKVLSKVVHPTALSIAAMTRDGSLDELMPLVKNHAVGNLLMVLYAIEEHIAAHGFGWPL